MGRLTRDPQIRKTEGENATTIARFTLAVDRRGRRTEGQQTADFINCIAFGKGAEFADKYLRQGTKIVTRGHIQTGSYTNRDGVKVYTTDVIADEMEFAESKRENAPADHTATQQVAGATTQSTPASVYSPIPDDDLEADLPFA